MWILKKIDTCFIVYISNKMELNIQLQSIKSAKVTVKIYSEREH